MKKKICLLLVLILSLIVIPVGAKSKENLIASDSAKVNKAIGATTFVAGNNVNVDSTIDGAAFVAGNNVSLAGTQDYLFAAGNIITVNGVNTKDAFIAGSSINIESSTIRDLYAAAQTIRIDSNIGRNVYLGGNEVIINGVINGDVEIAAESIKIGQEAEITGTLNYPETADINIAETAKVANTTTYKSTEVTEKSNIMTSITDRIYSFLGMLVVGLVLMAFNKKMFTKISKIKKDVGEFAKNVGIGFIFLAVVPLAAIIVMCTGVGVPLGIISLMLYGILLYISVIPTAYYLGNAFLKKKIKNEFLLFAVTLFALYVLKLVPGLGGLITFISMLFGLGVFFELIRSNIKTK